MLFPGVKVNGRRCGSRGPPLLAFVGMLLLRSGDAARPWAVRASYDALYAFPRQRPRRWSNPTRPSCWSTSTATPTCAKDKIPMPPGAGACMPAFSSASRRQERARRGV